MLKFSSPGAVVTVLMTSAVTAGLVIGAPSAAVATPPAGVAAKLLAEFTVGNTDYVLREITIQPGGTTRWHWHDGSLYGVVKSGTLTHEMADCTSIATYAPGSTILEESGADKVHRGVNTGTTPVVLDVLYVDPKGTPLSEDAADPGCLALP